jgi:hypothetical protein
LSEPGVELHALDLVGAGPSAHDDGGALLDSHAKAQYRRRLEDLRAELAEGEAWGDGERMSRAREEMAFVADELRRAVGLGGRDRLAASNAERARVSVTRAIRGAIRKINSHDPRLGAYLSASIRTGQFCSYAPSAHAPVDFRVDVAAVRRAA